MYEQLYHGIVPQAAALTLGVGLGLGLLYQNRVIRVSNTFVRWVSIATFGVVGYYVLVLAGHFFHMQVPGYAGNGWLSIGLSLLICGIASANYLIDFRLIEEEAAQGLPKWAEWSGAFGLLITTISVRYNKTANREGRKTTLRLYDEPLLRCGGLT